MRSYWPCFILYLMSMPATTAELLEHGVTSDDAEAMVDEAMSCLAYGDIEGALDCFGDLDPMMFL